MRIALASRSSLEHAAGRGDVKALCGAKVSRLIHRAWSASSPNACRICAQRIRGAKQRTAKPRTKLRAELDRTFAAMIRASGPCAARDYPGHRCAGPLQCAHLRSRRYEAVRWSTDNAWPLCSGAHRFFTLRPLEWEEFIIGRIGQEAWAALKHRALSGARPDYAELLVRLRDQEGAAG